MATTTLPAVLVTTDWVAQHATDAGVRVVEVDVDTTAYDQGHVPGAAGWNWATELCDTLTRDIVPIKKLEELLGKSGIDNKTTIVLYGDNNNWFAAWAFWQLKMYGHDDVRSPQEFTGEILAPPGLPETCQRGGHIPGAKSIPWAKACNDDGTFKSVEDLKALYGAQGVTADKPVIAYCRIGERSSHTWFVLKYLLGFENVKNYDGSWTEWGNLVGAAVEKP